MIMNRKLACKLKLRVNGEEEGSEAVVKYVCMCECGVVLVR